MLRDQRPSLGRMKQSQPLYVMLVSNVDDIPEQI